MGAGASVIERLKNTRFAVGLLSLLALAALVYVTILRPSTSPLVMVEAGVEGIPTPNVDRLYFLKGIDFETGDFTLVLGHTNRDRVIIQDETAMRAAAKHAYINTTDVPEGAVRNFFRTAAGGHSTVRAVQLFKDDLLIGGVICTDTSCISRAPQNVDALQQAATPYDTVVENFDTYDSYLDALARVRSDPDLLILDKHLFRDLPVLQVPSTLTLRLPNVITDEGAQWDLTAYSDLVKAALIAELPEGATIDWIRIAKQDPPLVYRAPGSAPAYVNGETVSYPHADFYAVRAKVTGVYTLSRAAYDRVTHATRRAISLDDTFADFVAKNLGSDCASCFVLRVDGPFVETVTSLDWHKESYALRYYDVRDAW